MDVAATPAHRTTETEATQRMIDCFEERLGVKPKRLIGDTADGTAEILSWMIEREGIAPHAPLREKGERGDGRFSGSAFTCDAASNARTCPCGKMLRTFNPKYETPRCGVDKDGQRRYRASQKDCRSYASKEQSRPVQPIRIVVHSVHERARDVPRSLAGAPEYLQSRKDPKKVELLFAHLKRILQVDRLRLRGLSGASDAFDLAAAAHNLHKMAMGVIPPLIREGVRKTPRTPARAPSRHDGQTAAHASL